jgi:hypothetical protein
VAHLRRGRDGSDGDGCNGSHGDWRDGSDGDGCNGSDWRDGSDGDGCNGSDGDGDGCYGSHGDWHDGSDGDGCTDASTREQVVELVKRVLGDDSDECAFVLDVQNHAGGGLVLAGGAGRHQAEQPRSTSTHPWGVAVSPDGKYAYVTASHSNSLAVLDVSRFDYCDLQQPRVRLGRARTRA